MHDRYQGQSWLSENPFVNHQFTLQQCDRCRYTGPGHGLTDARVLRPRLRVVKALCVPPTLHTERTLPTIIHKRCANTTCVAVCTYT